MRSSGFSTTLLHPRYWPTWLSFGLLALIAQLPYRTQIFIGKCFGSVAYRLAHKRRMIASKNVAMCFPEMPQEEQQQLVRRHFETNGIALIEIGMAWFMPYQRLQKRFVIKGKEHWDNLKQQGLGALIITIHFNTLEIANLVLNRHFNMYMTYRPHRNPVYNFIQCKGRERHNPRSGVINRKDIRRMIKVLKQGDWLWYAPDQDYGRRVSEFVPWFGIMAATVSATPRLLRMSGVPAVGLMYRRLPDYQGYEIEFMPIIEGLPSGDDKADLVKLNRHIEQCIRSNPTEYLWIHRRFKTCPEDRLYPYRELG